MPVLFCCCCVIGCQKVWHMRAAPYHLQKNPNIPSLNFSCGPSTYCIMYSQTNLDFLKSESDFRGCVACLWGWTVHCKQISHFSQWPWAQWHVRRWGFDSPRWGVAEKVQWKIILVFFPSWEHREVRNTAVRIPEITGNVAHSLHKHSWPNLMMEILLQERLFTLWFA